MCVSSVVCVCVNNVVCVCVSSVVCVCVCVISVVCTSERLKLKGNFSFLTSKLLLVFKQVPCDC